MYNPVVEIWKMWGERDSGTTQCWQRGEREGEGSIYWVPLLQRGIGGGIGNKPALSGGGGRRDFDHSHQHIPHTPLSVLKRRIQFLLITEWRSNGVTSLAMGIRGWVAWVCFIFLIILSRGSIYQSINQSINRCGLHCFCLVVQSCSDNLPISSSSSSSSSSYYHFIWLCISIIFSYGLL